MFMHNIGVEEKIISEIVEHIDSHRTNKLDEKIVLCLDQFLLRDLKQVMSYCYR